MIHRINSKTSSLRQIVSVLLIFCLLLVPFSSIVQANSVVPVSVELSSVSGASGDTVDVAVTVDPGDFAVSGYTLDLIYDLNVLELVEPFPLTDQLNSYYFDYVVNSDGTINLTSIYPNDYAPLVTKEEVFVIHFKIKETAGTVNTSVGIISGTYTMDDLEWFDITQIVPGLVTVNPIPDGNSNPEELKILIGDATGSAGELVDVPVSILESADAVAAYGMRLDFDPDALEVVDVQGETGDYFDYNHDDAEGWLKVAWTDIEGGDHAAGAGDKLFTVTFKIKDDAMVGDTLITVNNVNDPDYITFTDTELNEMEKTVIDGKVTVIALTHAEAPVIMSQPDHRTVNVGGTADLSVTATANGELSYQWYSNTVNSTVGGTPIAWATNATYSVPTNQAGTLYYYVVVTNTDDSKTGETTATATSAVAEVVVNALTNAQAPAITDQPVDRTVNVGGAASLGVMATASGAMSYQWYSNVANATEGGTPITGATNATFSAPTNAAGTMYYYVVVTNTDSSMTGLQTALTTSSIVKVTVNEITNAEAPTISGQPEDRTVNVGGTADISVAATASGTLSYQWYSNAANSTTGGTAITGATNATFSAPTSAAGTLYYYVVITNTDNSKTGQQTATVTSSVAKVMVNAITNAEAPVISAQPVDRTVNVGGIVALNVTATASGALSYQWYSNEVNSTIGGTAINGATSPVFIAPAGAAGTTYYYVVVTNTDNSKTGVKVASATSSVAKVTVNALTNAEAPTISSQPEDRTVNVDGTADLSVAATASGALSYQWYSNAANSTIGGTAVPGATAPVFLAPAGAAGTTYYYVEVINTDNSKTGVKVASATSSVAKVTVNALTNAEAPTISSQPEDRTVNIGDHADLSVAATASGTLSYQWYSNAANSTTGGMAITGATNATFSAPTSAAGTTYYYVVITNTDNSKTGQQTATVSSSVAKVTVNTLTNAEAPVISSQPVDRTVNVGGHADLSVAATANGALSYQWYSNAVNSTIGGTAITGATNATFSAPTSAAGTTYYYVVVTNTDNSKTGEKTASVTSAVAKVTVNTLTNAEAPTISSQPADRTVNVGGHADLGVAATASGVLSYQWYSNAANSTTGGMAITGATNATFSAPTSAAGTLYYYVVVTNTDNSKTGEKTASVTSAVAKVTVNTLTNAEVPVISSQPADRTVNVGGHADLGVAATASGALSYQWYSNAANSTIGGTAVTGATNATFSAPTSAAGTTYYYVVVTNTDNSKTGEKTAFVTSAVAKVTVITLTNAEAPVISTQPEDRTVNVGGTADLGVAATASGVLSYQWYSNAANSTTGGTAITGATNATFSAPTSAAGTTYYYVVVTNTDSSKTDEKTASVTSAVAKVTVNTLTNAEVPVISSQPVDRTVNVGGHADLSVAATANGALSYQWYSNAVNSTIGGTAITGATNATFSAPTSAAGTTYYYVVITNTDNSKTGQQTATVSSSVAKVTVNTLTNAEVPVISSQPADRTVNVGGTADLGVAATANGALSYQWYSNAANSTTGGMVITGATNATFSAPTSAAGTTYYYVVVTNTDNSKTGEKTASVTSAVAKVTVNTLTNAEVPTISSQPADRTVNVGGHADLGVAATASGTLSYQWYSNAANSTTGGTAITGATNATFSAPTSAAGTLYYYVVITNTDNSKTGQQTATVTSSVAKVTVNTLTNAEAPVISTQPEDRTVNVGGIVVLNVSATASGALSYQWYSNAANSTIGGTAVTGATNATFSAPTSAAGTTYYYVVVTNTDNSKTGEKTASVTSAVAKVTVNTLTNAEAPVISTQPADRTVNVGGTADLSVAATSSGALSYQWYSNAANSTTGGKAITGATNATFSAPTSAAGTTYYYVVVTNTDNSKTGEKTASVTSAVAKVVVKPKAPSTSEPSQNETTEPTNTGVDVLVNGKPENAGTAVTTQVGDKKMITVTIDQKKLDEKLASEDKGATVVVPVHTDSNIVVGELNGQMIKNMEKQQAKLVIETKNASYTLPAVQINIDSVSELIGSEVSLQDIKVQVKISEPDNEMFKVVESASKKGAFDLVAPPIEFIVTGEYGGKTVEVSKYNTFVERTIAIPEGVDPSQVTTAIVVDTDGTVRHVPTQITVIDGKYFAKINSLTNSTYSVIWNPVTFKDVEQHWAKEAINDIGSRMIIDGVGNGNFDPNRDITRAEFAAIIVRGLGLKPENSKVPFSDVKSTDWYSGYIGTAQSYNLINGFNDGSFRPMEKITREQAMVILAKAAKITGLKLALQTSDNAELLQAFTDSSQVSAWATADVIDCLQVGIVLGRNGNRLEPQASISRAEVAIMIQRLLQYSSLI